MTNRQSSTTRSRAPGRLAPLAALGLALALGSALLPEPSAGSARTPAGAEDVGAATTAAPLPLPAARLEAATGYALERRFTGQLQAARDASVGFQVGGAVAEVLVRTGDRVEAGAVLARLDTRRPAAALAAAEARIAAAEAEVARLEAGPRTETIAAAAARLAALERQLDAAVALAERRRGLYAEAWIPFEQLDQAEAEARTLTARRDEARSALDELEAGTRAEDLAAGRASLAEAVAARDARAHDLDDAVLVAPFAGRVAERLVDEGEVVEPGRPALRLVEDRALEAWVGLPLDLATRLAGDDDLTLTAGGAPVATTRPRLLPEVDAATRTATLVLDLADAGDLRAGQVVELTATTAVAETGLWVPRTALDEDLRGLWSLVVLEPAGDGADPAAPHRAARALVEVLHLDGERAYVRGPLAPGALVATAGHFRVTPGTPVRPRLD